MQITIRTENIESSNSSIKDDPIATIVPQCKGHLAKLTQESLDLDGRNGLNRNHDRCLITAKNDLEAIRNYLYRFRHNKNTRRSYEKELTRFLYWCVSHQRVAMSSVLTEECEAYKDFIANPAPDWVGPRTNRNSSHWRPFTGPLLPESQRYAIQLLRNFFSWLTSVRYLYGNPWITVTDPMTEQTGVPMNIGKALPANLWDRLAKHNGILDRVCAAYANPAQRPALAKTPHPTRAKQFRLARSIILLIGCTGARREEAATAQRNHLTPVPKSKENLWELKVLGKRNKWRSVFLPTYVVDAIRAHWNDRGLNFEKISSTPLFSPLVIPPTEAAKRKYLCVNDKSGQLAQRPYTADAFYKVVKMAFLRTASDSTLRLTMEDREILRASAPPCPEAHIRHASSRKRDASRCTTTTDGPCISNDHINLRTG